MRHVEVRNPPRVNRVEGNWVEVLELFAAAPHRDDEVCIFKNLKVPGRGLPRHVHGGTKCRQRLAVFGAKTIEEVAAGPICQRFEDAVVLHAP